MESDCIFAKQFKVMDIENTLRSRYDKVKKLLNYMLSDNNSYKALQCYRIFDLINEVRQNQINNKQNHLKSIL